mmetsp:Transcript_2866/g.11239  ORF Transcript_2866/g.11239 Transcript_2866/m.11239 type:complete len:222 (+) Transcript_2866:444-1109(+)
MRGAFGDTAAAEPELPRGELVLGCGQEHDREWPAQALPQLVRLPEGLLALPLQVSLSAAGRKFGHLGASRGEGLRQPVRGRLLNHGPGGACDSFASPCWRSMGDVGKGQKQREATPRRDALENWCRGTAGGHWCGEPPRAEARHLMPESRQRRGPLLGRLEGGRGAGWPRLLGARGRRSGAQPAPTGLVAAGGLEWWRGCGCGRGLESQVSQVAVLDGDDG